MGLRAYGGGRAASFPAPSSACCRPVAAVARSAALDRLKRTQHARTWWSAPSRGSSTQAACLPLADTARARTTRALSCTGRKVVCAVRVGWDGGQGVHAPAHHVSAPGGAQPLLVRAGQQWLGGVPPPPPAGRGRPRRPWPGTGPLGTAACGPPGAIGCAALTWRIRMPSCRYRRCGTQTGVGRVQLVRNHHMDAGPCAAHQGARIAPSLCSPAMPGWPQPRPRHVRTARNSATKGRPGLQGVCPSWRRVVTSMVVASLTVACSVQTACYPQLHVITYHWSSPGPPSARDTADRSRQVPELRVIPAQSPSLWF